MRIYTGMCVCLTVAGAACASSQAEQVHDARMEQVDARTVARTRAIEDREAARNEAIASKHDTDEDRIDATETSHDKRASEQLNDVAEERSAYQSKVRARIETIGVRIRAAHEKLATVGPRAPIQLGNDLDTLHTEYTALDRDIRELPNTPADGWESTESKLDHRLDDLNRAVKVTTRKIEDL